LDLDCEDEVQDNELEHCDEEGVAKKDEVEDNELEHYDREGATGEDELEDDDGIFGLPMFCFNYFLFSSRCNFFGNLFSESDPFSSHVQSLSLQRSVTNSRPYPQTHVLITNWLSSVTGKLYK